MALPSTGAISMSQVRIELKRSGTIALNDSDVRSLAGKTSGTISMNDLRGKSNSIYVSNKLVFSFTASGITTQGNWSKTFSLQNSVISGTFTMNYNKQTKLWESNVKSTIDGYVKILNNTISATGKKQISVPKGTTSVTISGQNERIMEWTHESKKHYSKCGSVTVYFTGYLEK